MAIKLSDLPTRKIIVEEPITEELRAAMLERSRLAHEKHNSPKASPESAFIDGTLATPVYADISVYCDVTMVDC
jgi:hypothetical protein